jgi:hypothetical protein
VNLVTPDPGAANSERAHRGTIVAQQTHQENRAPAHADAGRRARRTREKRSTKVSVEHDGGQYTVAVRGQVDRPTVTEFSGTVRGLVAVGVPELTVDLGGCWEGARLLTVLTRTRRALIDRGGRLNLVGVALPEYLAALYEAPLDEVFLVYDAMRHISARRTGSPAEDDVSHPVEVTADAAS